MEWAVASRTYEPTRQPEIRKPNYMIRVEVCEKDAVNILPANSELPEALQGTSACVNQELLPTDFNESAWPESMHGGWRSSGTQERHLDLLPDGKGSGRDKRHESESDARHPTDDA